jgi:hypothetical protein
VEDFGTFPLTVAVIFFVLQPVGGGYKNQHFQETKIKQSVLKLDHVATSSHLVTRNKRQRMKKGLQFEKG